MIVLGLLSVAFALLALGGAALAFVWAWSEYTRTRIERGWLD